MGTHITTIITEQTTSEKVIAEITLNELPEDIEYTNIMLGIDDKIKAIFDADNKAMFNPSQVGEIPCEIIFYNEDEEVERWSDTIEISLQTYFAGVHADVGHPLQMPKNLDEIELFKKSVPRGNNDICFRMVFRIPEGQSMTIDATINQQSDSRPIYNKALQVHYREADYANRNDLYTPPDEAMYHIDAEDELWIEGPITLEHGIHTIYVVPSVEHDLSYLIVSVQGEYGFNVTGYFKTIDYEGLGLLP